MITIHLIRNLALQSQKFDISALNISKKSRESRDTAIVDRPLLNHDISALELWLEAKPLFLAYTLLRVNRINSYQREVFYRVNLRELKIFDGVDFAAEFFSVDRETAETTQ